MIQRWISPVNSACGTTFRPPAAVPYTVDRATGSSRSGVAESSQSSHIENWALAVISGGVWVVDAPQLVHRHRVLPAEVLPFLTSVVVHTPHRGRLSPFFTTHAFTEYEIFMTESSKIPSASPFPGLNPDKAS